MFNRILPSLYAKPQGVLSNMFWSECFLFLCGKIIQLLSNVGKEKTNPYAGVLICSHLLGLFAELSLKEGKHLVVNNNCIR